MTSRSETPFRCLFWTGLVAITLLSSLSLRGTAQNSLILQVHNANWVATDDLNRTLPTYAEVGPPKPNRWVGMFYWHWHGPDRWGPDYNVTEFMKTHPGFSNFQAFPPNAPGDPTWYWAEPLFGYYRSDDPWVIRKHLVLIADAGVDFLFFDYTNGVVYDREMQTFLDVAEDLKQHGVAIPKLVFFVNVEPEKIDEKLYTRWYKPGKYDDMWFRWQGKPLIMSPIPTEAAKFANKLLQAEISQYFTFRPTWAFQDASKEPTKWRFMDKNPQRPALGPDSKIEQMVVSKSLGGPIWDNMQKGGVSSTPTHVPTYDNRWTSPENGQGLFFQYQWEQAEQVAAPILLVTGWNEWTASVWETPGVVMLGHTTQKGEGHIVDEFNMDFNRDLEPMKGGYRDNYYWQFVANMRRYKGMLAPEPASAPKTIPMDGDFTHWAGVKPLYRHAVSVMANRDWDGCTPNAHYTDNSARNAISLAQVVRDAKNLYFHVQTAAPLSPSTDKNWMLLLIDTDAKTSTGWYGYDFLVNRSRDGRTCTVEKNVDGNWNWQVVAHVPIRTSGKDLEIAIPRSVFGLQVRKVVINFKWVDNIPDNPDIMDFYSKGDAAPDARFNYHYATPGLR